LPRERAAPAHEAGYVFRVRSGGRARIRRIEAQSHYRSGKPEHMRRRAGAVYGNTGSPGSNGRR
jgi:hypothetical protein